MSKVAYIVGAGMSLFPLHQEQLGHHQSSNKDEDHFSMHGFMAAMLGMHACELGQRWYGDKGAVLSRDTHWSIAQNTLF